ncbi:MAG TPA: archaellin/type IV pilin N-terminal domain-containing protein [Dehalococcoidia bacterium]|jgi:flagellin FlaB|nr:archaellin/type IV pilin N-terminal domain-containing protein [Dehalococcoidia bacterium]
MRKFFRFFHRAADEERGITGLETAIILIAFVVVAAVFAFVVLSTGLFSSERGKETIYAGLQKTRGNLELRGSVIANKATSGTTRVDTLVFDLGLAAGGEPVNLDPSASVNKTVVAYIDESTNINNLTYSVSWVVGDTDNLLEPGELAEVTVDIDAAGVTLANNDTFTLEVRPPLGAYLVIQRTLPAGTSLENVTNLR